MTRSSATADAVAAKTAAKRRATAPTQAAVRSRRRARAERRRGDLAQGRQALRRALQLVDLMSSPNAKVVAAQDGRIVKLGSSHKLGKYLILRDVYGDVFTYAGLGSIASHYPRPKAHTTPAASTPALPAVSKRRTQAEAARDRRQSPSGDAEGLKACRQASQARAHPWRPANRRRRATGKVRLFAHPGNPDAVASAASRRKRAARSTAPARRCRCASARSSPRARCSGSVRTPPNAHDGHLRFAIRPGGDQSSIDPRPILKNWAQLGVALHPQGATGDTNLLGATASGVFLMSQDELRARRAVGPRHPDLCLRPPGHRRRARSTSACSPCSPSSRASA